MISYDTRYSELIRTRNHSMKRKDVRGKGKIKVNPRVLSTDKLQSACMLICVYVYFVTHAGNDNFLEAVKQVKIENEVQVNWIKRLPMICVGK